MWDLWKIMPLRHGQGHLPAAYWDLLHLDQVDQLSPAIAAEIFDTAVNCGVGVPIPFLQRALNAFNRQGTDYPDIPVDGLTGPTTIAALRAFLHVRGALGEKVMLGAKQRSRASATSRLLSVGRSQEDFEFGWWAQRVAL
jgi:lysozyme family protein